MKHLLLLSALAFTFFVKAQNCVINSQTDIFLSDTASFEYGEGVDSVPLNTPVYFRVSLWGGSCKDFDFQIVYNGKVVNLGPLHNGELLFDDGDGWQIRKIEYTEGFDITGKVEMDLYPGYKYKAVTVYDPILGVESDLENSKVLETQVYNVGGVLLDSYSGSFDERKLNEGVYIYKSTLDNGRIVKVKHIK